MTKQLVYVLVWMGPLPHDMPNVEVFDSTTLLHSFRLQKRILDGYSIHNRTVWAGREEDKVVAQPVESVGRFTAATHPDAEPVNWSGRAGG